jgi:hypothetical protein
MIDCEDPAASLRSIDLTDGEYLCPAETLYTSEMNLPSGALKTVCLERI